MHILLMSYSIGIAYIISLAESTINIVVRFRCNVRLFLLSIPWNRVCSENPWVLTSIKNFNYQVQKT